MHAARPASLLRFRPGSKSPVAIHVGSLRLAVILTFARPSSSQQPWDDALHRRNAQQAGVKAPSDNAEQTSLLLPRLDKAAQPPITGQSGHLTVGRLRSRPPPPPPSHPLRVAAPACSAVGEYELAGHSGMSTMDARECSEAPASTSCRLCMAVLREPSGFKAANVLRRGPSSSNPEGMGISADAHTANLSGSRQFSLSACHSLTFVRAVARSVCGSPGPSSDHAGLRPSDSRRPGVKGSAVP